MDIINRFVVQLIENPIYFKKTPPAQETAWEHWDKAFPLLIAIGAFVLLLVVYKLASRFLGKQFLSRFLKWPRRKP